MNRTVESELIDHVQVCKWCKAGITFVPATIQWWRTTPDRTLSDGLAQRIYCKSGDSEVHAPDTDRALQLDRYRKSKEMQQIGLPYDASHGTL